MSASTKKVIWFGLAILVFSCIAAVQAQEKNEALGGGSLVALTAEVQQLRLAVEESMRSQTQTQALGVYLSAQQSRILQVASRLDASRRDLEGITNRSQATANRLANIDDSLSNVTNPNERLGLENEKRMMVLEQKSISLQEQQARDREAELSQALQIENDRWTELIKRLE